MKRVAVILAIVAVIAALILLVTAKTYLTPQSIQATLENLLGEPVEIGHWSTASSPLRIEVANLRVGASGWLQIDHAVVQLDLSASVDHIEPALGVEVSGLRIDWIARKRDAFRDADEQGPQQDLSLPTRLRLASLVVRDFEFGFEIGDDPTVVNVAAIEASAMVQRSAEITDISLSLTDGWLRANHEAIHVSRGGFNGELSRRGLLFADARAFGPRIDLVGKRDSLAYDRLQVEGTFDLPLLGVFVDNLRHLTGAAALRGYLDGTIANPRADIALEVEDGAIAGRPVGNLSTRMIRVGYDMDFHDGIISGDPGEIRARAHLDFRGHGVSLTSSAESIDVDINGVLAALRTPLIFEALRYRGSATVVGPLDPLELHVQGSGKVSPDGAGMTKDIASIGAIIDLDGVARPSRAEFDVSLAQPEGNLVEGRVEIDSALSSRFSVEASDVGALAQLAPKPVPELDLGGTLKGNVTTSGDRNDPHIEIHTKASEVRLGDASVDQLDGSATIQSGRMEVGELRATTGGGRLSVDGSVALTRSTQNDWHAVLEDADAEILYFTVKRLWDASLPLEGGGASGTIAVQGAWSLPTVTGDLEISTPELFQETLRAVDAKIDVRAGVVNVATVAKRAEGDEISVVFDQSPRQPPQFALHAEDLAFRTIDDAGEPAWAGRLSVDGRLTGPWEVANGRLTASIDELVGEGNRWPELSAVANVDAGVARLELHTSDDRLAGSGELRLKAPFPMRFDARWQGLLLERPLGKEPLRVDASAEAHLEAELEELRVVRGTIDVASFNLRRGDYVWSLAQPIQVVSSDGTFRWRGATIEGGKSALRIDGEASTSGEVHINANGTGDLNALELVGEPIESASGRSEINLSIARTPESPWRINGTFRISDGIVDLGLPVAPADISGVLHFSGKTVTVEDVSGTLGGGSFSIGGKVDLDRGPNVSWIVDRAGLDVIDDLEAEINGRGSIEGSWSMPTLVGDVEILQAVYDRDVKLADLYVIIRNKLVGDRRPGRNRTAGGWGLDLQLRAPGGVFLDNNIAKVEGAVRLRVQGTVHQPNVSGVIRILDGEVQVRQHKFTVTSGSIDFRDPMIFNPTLSISGETRIITSQGDYQILANIGGSAEDPRIVFTSDDASLTQNDILALVTVGRTAAELQRGGGGVTALDALVLVPTGPVEQQLENLVGIDQLEIRAIEQEETGRVEPQIRIGKRVTNRIRASVASSIGVRSRRSVELEYDLTRRISLLGSWEEESNSSAGAFGGAVKFRYEFRRSPISILRQMLTDRDVAHEAPDSAPAPHREPAN